METDDATTNDTSTDTIQHAEPKPATPSAVLAALREQAEGGDPIVVVSSVTEADTAPIPDTPEQAKKRKEKRNRWRDELLAAGLSPQQVDLLVVKREVHGTTQRKPPYFATACSAMMIEFFADRTEEEIRGDMFKLLRLDGGGKFTPEGKAEEIVRSVGGDPKAAAKLLVEREQQRMDSARAYAVICSNELERRRAAREGKDPTKVTYIMIDLRPLMMAMGAPPKTKGATITVDVVSP